MKINPMKKRAVLLALTALCAITLAGCSRTDERQNEDAGAFSSIADSSIPAAVSAAPDAGSSGDSSQEEPVQNSETAAELYVRFGDNGSPFPMHLYDNDTAAAIARHVGTADWRLPIYNYDGYDNWEVMQYYDIPSRYEIPSNPESVTTEQAGTVYYSEPNRIVLFYGDAEVSGEYTPVGYFDDSEAFRSAVADNPALEGWGNKIVLISAEE